MEARPTPGYPFHVHPAHEAVLRRPTKEISVKRTAKKLQLGKETMRSLETKMLGRAHGAGQTVGTNCLTWLCATTDGPFECADACIAP